MVKIYYNPPIKNCCRTTIKEKMLLKISIEPD